MFELTLSALLLWNAAILIVLLLFFAGLVLNKQKELRRAIREGLQKERLRPLVSRYIQTGILPESRHLNMTRAFLKGLDQLLEEYARVMKQAEIKERINTLADIYLKGYLRDMLKHRQWAIRMNTLYKIEDYRFDQLETEVWSLYARKPKDQEELYQAMRALAAVQSTRLETELFTDSGRYALYPRFLLKDLFRRFDDAVFYKAVNQYSTLHSELQLALLDLIGERKDLQCIQLLEEQLQHEDLEHRLSALKALHAIGYTTDPECILSFGDSAVWQERMMFARMSGKLLKERYKPVLMKLIGDKEWFVRNAAGESIACYPDGQMLLDYIIEQHADPFAKDTAQQWILREGRGTYAL